MVIIVMVVVTMVVMVVMIMMVVGDWWCNSDGGDGSGDGQQSC